MLPETISTQRLRLRSFERADRAAVERHLGSWEVARMMTSVPYPYPQDGFATLLARATRERAAGGAIYAVERASALLGGVGLNPQESGVLSLGYWVAPQAWAQGVATEAAGAACRAAFQHSAAPALVARRLEDNPVSARVLQKLGFVETGTLEHWCEARRARVTSILSRLERESWAHLGAARAQAGVC